MGMMRLSPGFRLGDKKKVTLAGLRKRPRDKRIGGAISEMLRVYRLVDGSRVRSFG